MVTRRFPTDDDAATLFAESMMDLRPWHYWTNAGRPLAPSSHRAGGRARAGRDAQPEPSGRLPLLHPRRRGLERRGAGAALRQEAADAGARRGSPGPHADAHLHAARHVGSGGGAQRARGRGRRAASSRTATRPGCTRSGYYPHNLDVMLAALGHAGPGRRDASRRRARWPSIVSYDVAEQVPPLEAYTVTPFYALARFGRWDEILKEPAPPAELRYASGVWHYMRGLAFAAKPALRQRRRSSTTASPQSPPAIDPTTVPQGSTRPDGAVRSRSMHLTADIASRQGKTDEALAALKKGIAIEDELTYSEPPDWYLPLRQPSARCCSRRAGRRRPSVAYRQDLRRFPQQRMVAAGTGRAKCCRAQKRDDERPTQWRRRREKEVRRRLTLLASRFSLSQLSSPLLCLVSYSTILSCLSCHLDSSAATRSSRSAPASCPTACPTDRPGCRGSRSRPRPVASAVQNSMSS